MITINVHIGRYMEITGMQNAFGDTTDSVWYIRLQRVPL